MQMKLELIPLPVSDVDRAIAFYADQLGFKKDVDVQPSEGVRVGNTFELQEMAWRQGAKY